MMSGKTLDFQIKNDIAYLILNNPPANPMTELFFDELANICEKHISKEHFEGLIIKSTGRHFSSGADVDGLLEIVKREYNKMIPTQMKKNLKAIQILYKIEKPVVALLKGICYGSAMELALSAHYRLATHTTILALPETTFGLMPGLGGISTLNQKIGFTKTLEMVMTGKAIFAEEALKIGLIDTIFNKDILELKAIEIIQNGRIKIN